MDRGCQLINTSPYLQPSLGLPSAWHLSVLPFNKGVLQSLQCLSGDGGWCVGWAKALTYAGIEAGRGDLSVAWPLGLRHYQSPSSNSDPQTEGSGQCSATISSRHGMLRAPGLS